MAAGALYVRGLKELQRDLRKISKDLDRGMTRELKKAGEPAADRAEQLALGRIRNMPRSPHWAGMRIGVGRGRGTVYMVPQARGGRGSGRANLSSLLLERAMEPAVEQTGAEIVEAIGDFFDRVADGNGF